MDFENFWKPMIMRQFGAAIGMLEGALHACPPALWADPSAPPHWKSHDTVGFWYVAYHTIFLLDYYTNGVQPGFAPPPPFNLDELDPAGLLPDQPYTKAELLFYLQYTRRSLAAYFDGLTAETAAAPCGFPGRNMSSVELLLHSMRHVQHHAAQLNLMLRQSAGSAPSWIFTAAVDAG
ncbi:DinB family protein [Paludibaculum fermentans]|uniref:DinB family protein n=1 Tax=Paludibaculum fermentans TaxID=1473598 RepID=UPI003EC01ABC